MERATERDLEQIEDAIQAVWAVTLTADYLRALEFAAVDMEERSPRDSATVRRLTEGLHGILEAREGSIRRLQEKYGITPRVGAQKESTN